ncbi:MAG: ribosomal protein S18-alanine N-acetyltransferase [Burkholderiaceae bacterium]
MSVVPAPDSSARQDWLLAPMTEADLPQVLAIENDVYSHPWTHGNFVDALRSGYHSRVLRDGGRQVLGYFLLMLAVDEAHLLNISVARAWQRRGIGHLLLDAVAMLARRRRMASILLEVRPSNQRAIAVYQRYGFVQIGVRRNYYPAVGATREDAIVMRLVL